MAYDTLHMTHDTLHVTPDMHHMVGGEYFLKISAPCLGDTVF